MTETQAKYDGGSIGLPPPGTLDRCIYLTNMVQALAECEARPVMGLPYALDVRVPKALWTLVCEEGGHHD